jgi:hypothetical protein
MKKNIEEQSNQLNLTVVALVALVAIVGLVALVMTAGSISKISTGSTLASAQQDMPDNLDGRAVWGEPESRKTKIPTYS